MANVPEEASVLSAFDDIIIAEMLKITAELRSAVREMRSEVNDLRRIVES